MITYTGYNRSWHGSMSETSARKFKETGEAGTYLICIAFKCVAKEGVGNGMGGFKWLADFKGGSFTARR